MSIIKSNYSSGKITLLRQLLENNAEAGTPSDYEIRVDGMKVVPRTNNPELFDNHEDFVNQDTAEITVIIYDGNSRRSTRHVMSMKEPKKDMPPPPAPTLSGLEIEKMLEEKLKAQREAFALDLLKKENKELKEQIEETEDYTGKLEEAVGVAKSNGNKIGGIHWGEIAGVALEGMIKRNAHLIAKIPGAEGLAGILGGADQTKLPEKQEPVCNASFKEKGEDAKEENENEEEGDDENLSEEERDQKGFLKQLQDHFKTEEKVKLIFALLNLLVKNPEAIEPAIVFVLGLEKEKKEQPKEESKPERKEPPLPDPDPKQEHEL